MNKITVKLSQLLLIGMVYGTAVTSGLADDSMKLSKPVVRREAPTMQLGKPLFRDNETSVDLFGSYTDTMSLGRFKDGFGGGLGVNHFFTKNIGLGLDAYAWNGDRPRDGITAALSGSVILRYPIEELHLAPYIFGGVGGIITKSTSPQLGEHAGLGVEYRFNENWGVFTDARYEFVNKDNDYILPRVGVRFTF